MSKSPGIAPIATEAAERLRRVVDPVMSVSTGAWSVGHSSAPTRPSPG